MSQQRHGAGFAIGFVPIRQAAGARKIRLAADRRWRDGSDTSPDGSSDRGDRLAADGRAGGATQAGRGLIETLLR